MASAALNISNTSNNGNNNNGGYTEVSKFVPERYVWAFICVVMIFSNAFLIILIFVYRKCRTIPNVIIASMSLNAILLAAVYLFPRFVLTSTVINVVYCQICSTLGSAFIINANLHLFLISLDQYIYIGYPFRYCRVVNKRRIATGLVIIWIICISISFIPYFWRRINLHRCTTVDHTKLDYENAFFLTYFIVLYFVPCGGMILFYGRIYFLAHLHAKRLRASNNPNCQFRRNVRAAKVLSILVGIYIACWTPFVTFFLVIRYRIPPNWTHQKITLVISILRYIAFSNPAINAFIYGYFNQVLRQHTIKAIKDNICCWSRSPPKSQNPTSSSYPTLSKLVTNNKMETINVDNNTIMNKLFRKDRNYRQHFACDTSRF